MVGSGTLTSEELPGIQILTSKFGMQTAGSGNE